MKKMSDFTDEEILEFYRCDRISCYDCQNFKGTFSYDNPSRCLNSLKDKIKTNLGKKIVENMKASIVYFKCKDCEHYTIDTLNSCCLGCTVYPNKENRFKPKIKVKKWRWVAMLEGPMRTMFCTPDFYTGEESDTKNFKLVQKIDSTEKEF